MTIDTSTTVLDLMIAGGYRHKRALISTNRGVSINTMLHEQTVAQEHTWPALPAHLRAMPDARAMVRHWVRTNYEWKP